MSKTLKQALALVLAIVMVLGLVACGNTDTAAASDTSTSTSGSTASSETAATASGEEAGTAENASYTYYSYASALGTNWNPHTWENSSDSDILSYITTPFVDLSIEDSEEQIYQWVYEAASSITDVTAEHQDLLTKYDTDSDGTDTDGYVFLFELRPEMKWEDGTLINADSYEYSLKALLDPAMLNYRANLYYSGESAIAGAKGYFYAGAEAFTTLSAQGYASADEAIAAGVSEDEIIIDCWNFWGAEGYTDAEGNECPQYVAMNDETVYGESVGDAFSGADLYAGYGAYLTDEGGYSDYIGTMVVEEAKTWDEVGFIKVDDYSFMLVTEVHNDINVFLTAMTDNWLVYEPYYEANKTTNDNGYVTTTYNSSKETTMSYGPYMIESFQDERQIVYVQNPNWWNYQTNDDGTLVSYTQFDVDGEPVEQYITTKIVVDVMDDNAAKLAFLKGELSAWTPAASELTTYATSDQLLRTDETYTIGLSFHTNLEDLQEMDASKGNTNSVVLNNDTFRKALSRAIDRSTYVTATAGHKPAAYTMNMLYYYDVYNDPTSQYRNTEQAMEAICKLYGVEYGEGKIYSTLKEAYESVTGYNLTEATELFTQACKELVAAGLYTEGEPITINWAMASGEISDSLNQQAALINQMVNAAMEGTGFGTFTLVPVGNLNDRYSATAAGEYAVNLGGWGGAAFYPYRNFQVYFDPDQYSITEAGCWDPTTETLTLNVNGEDVTMTYQMWSRCMVGSGEYAKADDQTKLSITADLEYNWLNKYYFIPIYSYCDCSMMSYQCTYYTTDYNIMYGYGGLRLLQWNYTDAEWADFVAGQGGTLNYE